MNKTLIEWVKNPDGTQGYTWNPITGCLNHTPAGLCLGGMFPCYAYKLANGRLKPLYLANEELAPYNRVRRFRQGLTNPLLDPFYPRFWSERCHGDLYTDSYPKHGKPKGIFVCDMSDLFGIGIPKEWTAEVLTEIELYPWHRFYLLTKQPQNLPQWSPFPPNCYVGVTVCNEPMFQEAMKYLPYVQAKVIYISFEPLMGRILTTPGQLERYINWVIIGAQTKPYKPPKIEWVEEIVNACDRAGVKVFLKDNLWPLIPPVSGILGQYKQNNKGINFYLRQEMSG